MSVVEKLASSLDDLVKSDKKLNRNRVSPRKTSFQKRNYKNNISNSSLIKTSRNVPSTKTTGERTNTSPSLGGISSLDVSLDDMIKKTKKSNYKNKPIGLTRTRIHPKTKLTRQSERPKINSRGNIKNVYIKKQNVKRTLFSGDGRRSAVIGANKTKSIKKTPGGRPIPETTSALRSVGRGKTGLGRQPNPRANLSIRNNNRMRVPRSSPLRKSAQQQQRQKRRPRSSDSDGDYDPRSTGYAYAVGARRSSPGSLFSSGQRMSRYENNIYQNRTPTSPLIIDKRSTTAQDQSHSYEPPMLLSLKDRKVLPKIKVFAQLDRVPDPLPIQQSVGIRMPKEIEENHAAMVQDNSQIGMSGLLQNRNLETGLVMGGPRQQKLSDRFSSPKY